MGLQTFLQINNSDTSQISRLHVESWSTDRRSKKIQTFSSFNEKKVNLMCDWPTLHNFRLFHSFFAVFNAASQWTWIYINLQMILFTRLFHIHNHSEVGQWRTREFSVIFVTSWFNSADHLHVVIWYCTILKCIYLHLIILNMISVFVWWLATMARTEKLCNDENGWQQKCYSLRN